MSAVGPKSPSAVPAKERLLCPDVLRGPGLF